MRDNKELEELADLLIEKTQNIPDDVKKAFVKRAVEDAKNLMQMFESTGKTDLKKLSFTIYRAYSLGAALYDGDKLISKEIDDEIEIDIDTSL